MTTAQQKGQRVAVFVDAQNLYYSARFTHKAHVNFKSLLQEATQKRTLTRALIYTIQTEDLSKESFFEALKEIGFEVRAKDLQIFADGSKKGDWDVGLAVDAIQLAPKIDTVILISGDGDFVPLVQYLQRAMGCRVEVMAFGSSTNKDLKEIADQYTDLEQNKKKFLLQKRFAKVKTIERTTADV